MNRLAASILLPLSLFATGGLAAEPVHLIEPDTALSTWKFNNGREFPGATGSLTLDPGTALGGVPSLKLVGDFTGGGGYVQAGRSLDDIDIRELSFQVRGAGTDRFTLRLGDSSGQTHQIVLKIDPEVDGWQQINLPLETFFANRGKADALTSIAKYESWGGAKDGNWHGPARGIYLLLSRGSENTVRTLWLNDVRIIPKPIPVAGAEMKSTVRLDEIVEGIHDWRFTNGPEFKGAEGSLTVVKDEPNPGQSCFRLEGNFSGGGAYVAAIRDLDTIDAAEVPAIRMRMKTANAKSFSVQLVDATGQTHQRKGLPLETTGQWQSIELIPSDIAGGEHWGGANDGRWHDPPRRLVISLTKRSNPPDHQPELLLADMTAEILLPVFARPPAFEKGTPLQLVRSLEKVNEPVETTTPEFAASPGRWQVAFSARANLHSPDNSYRGHLKLEALDTDGNLIESIAVTEVFGEQPVESRKPVLELPAGTVSARFRAGLEKTWGEFEISDLSASYLAPAPRRDDRIERLLFSTAQLGNLLFPEDSREVTVTIEARKPLVKSRRTLTWVLCDYWGAEQAEAGKVELGDPQAQKTGFVYQAKIDLSSIPLEVGRYYELHAAVGAAVDGPVKKEPFRNHTSLAILPEAVTKQYEPEEVPFTARNWDNRIPEFIRLTDRLGIRICGLWGGWKNQPPYEPSAPGLELCRELGMGWLTTTPAKFIERGKDDEWTEEALRQGVRNFLKAYGNERPLIINLGNEPHGTGERVEKNVAAYRVLYEEIKKFDPSLLVVATSVEPNEEYFKNGYGQWCDAYDFHIYEQPHKVRQTMERYGELMRKYDVVKPLWSTELGLNSQGQPRHEVAVQIFQKFCTFFAAGGENVSWFGLLYPDPDGKSHGSSGDSHNVFDCRFNRYCPRLDAVAYYHAVNAIAIKRFVEEKRYPNGVHAFLFRDRENRCLQILWNEDGPVDVFLPLPGVNEVELTRIDGRNRRLNAAGRGITLSITPDPLLLRYEVAESRLATGFNEPWAAIASIPEIITTAGGNELSVVLSRGSAADWHVTTAPFWKVDSSDPKNETVVYRLTPPFGSEVREGEFILTSENGELYRRIPVARSSGK